MAENVELVKHSWYLGSYMRQSSGDAGYVTRAVHDQSIEHARNRSNVLMTKLREDDGSGVLTWLHLSIIKYSCSSKYKKCGQHGIPRSMKRRMVGISEEICVPGILFRRVLSTVVMT